MHYLPPNRPMIYRQATWLLAVLIAILVALVLGDGEAYASPNIDYDDDRDGIPNSVECIGKATYLPLAVLNGSFETPDIRTTLSLTSKQWGSYPKIAVSYKSFLIDGWSTTATDAEIELWRSGYENVKAYDGRQFAEINANQSAALYQEVATNPGSTMRWSFAHRGRTGVDTIELLVGPPDGPYTSLGTFSTDKANWSVYSGTYLVPAEQTTTRYFYKAIATANGNTTTGNFLDDIQFFQLGNCDRDTDGDGYPNAQDLDSDNDGILDIIEGGLTDSNGDGEVDSEDQLGTSGAVPDHDRDGLPDFLDLDADGDGIPDSVEGQPTESYQPTSGTVNSRGIDNAHGSGNGFQPHDTDGDGDPDYLDEDSDNDKWSDTIEAHSELHDVDEDQDGLDRSRDEDDELWGPPSAGIIVPTTTYPSMDNETNWRNPSVIDDGRGVGSGETGGLESEPLAAPPSRFIGSIGTGDSIAAASNQPSTGQRHKAHLLESHIFGLNDLMPAAGPLNTRPSPAVPVDVLAVTNAPDAQAVDFVDPHGNIQGVALGILSMDAPYVHDYGVCNRFKGFTFDQIAPQQIDVPPADQAWFWHSTASSNEYGYEDALIFHVFVNEQEKNFHIDSRWVQDSYQGEFDFAFDYIFNMQVWSKTPQTSEQLLQAILLRLESFGEGDWTVTYHNQTMPPKPSVIVRAVTSYADTIDLSLAALSGTAETVRIYGTWRSQTDRLTLQPFEQTIQLSATDQTIPLTLPGLLDATVFVESNGFVDKVYSGGGLWFAAGPTQDDGMLTLGVCRDVESVDKRDLLLAGCAELPVTPAAQADSVGIGRTLNPNGMPVDVSPYQALRFWAKGNDTPVRILLESAAISDADYYQVVFVPSAEWQEYIIPLAKFQQRGFGVAQPFSGNDLKAVLWLNAEANTAAMSLALDQVSFTNTGLLTATALATDGEQTTPRAVQFTLPESNTTALVNLYYSLNEGDTYERVAMNTLRQSEGQVTIQGEIPGQPLGSDIRYYVELEHTNGYISRMPIDAPRAFYRYRVDDRETVLVDDFGGSRPYNRLDGNNGLFNAPTDGGTLRAYHEENTLRLAYDVSSVGQYAGYYTELGHFDSRTFSTVDLLVRGKIGNEQVFIGLRDASGFEPRLSIGDLLPGGVTTEWKWVQVPLAAFGETLDQSDLESLSLTFYNGTAPTTGELYVNEIRFTTLAVATVVDHFDDNDLKQNAQGLGYWTSAPGSTLVAQPVAGDALHNSGYALQLDYTVGTNGYAVWHSELAKPATTDTSVVTFWVRGETEPVPVSIYLTNGDHRVQVALADYLTLDGTWQFVQIPLADFSAQGLDRQGITGFEVAFEFAAGSGTLWIDTIQIGTVGAPQALQRTLHLQDVDSSAVALHLPYGGAWTVTSDVAWLALGESGAGADTLLVQSYPWNMSPGDYTGTVTITTAPGAQEKITVLLKVVEPNLAPNQIFLPSVWR